MKNNTLVKLLACLLVAITIAIFTPSQPTFAQGAGGGSGGSTSNPYVYKFTVNVWDSVNKHVASGVSVKWSKGSANGAGTTNSSGAVTFGARDAGSYSISATKGSCGTSYSLVTIGANNPGPSLQLYLSYCPSEKPPVIQAPKTVTLTVKTLAATGASAPIANASVRACPTNTSPSNCFTGTTGSDGIVKLSIRTNSEYDLYAENTSLGVRATKHISVSTTAQTITLGLAKAQTGIIKGTVFFGQNAYTGADVKVALSGNASVSTTTSTTGGYSFTKLTVPSTYTVKIQAPTGFVVSSTNPVTGINPPTSPNSSQIVNFTIKRKSLTISGKVVNSSGTGLSGITVRATNLSTGATKTTTSGNSGAYILTISTLGTYSLQASSANGYQGSRSYPDITYANSGATEIARDFHLVSDGSSNTGGNTGGTTGGTTGGNTTSPNPSTKPVTSPTSAIYTIKGQIYLQQGSTKKKYTGGGMNVTATNLNNQHKTVKVASDGTYAITGLTQKQYTVLTTAPSGTKLTSANNVKVTFQTTSTTSLVDFTLASTVTPTPTATLTPTPTATLTPSPSISSAPSPSPSPSVTNMPSVTTSPTPTITLIPTATLVPSANTFVFTVFLHGIGNTGDSVSPGNQVASAPLPLHQQRRLTFEIVNDKQEVVVTKTGTITYNPAQSSFTGTIDAGKSLVSGSYIIKIKLPQHLKKQIPGIQTIVTGQSLTLPPVTLTSGDIDHNNRIDIRDYNILIGCYSDLKPAVACVDDQNQDADINDDGKVNQFDYNLFLRELSVQPGN